jgi:hypothetical protein
VHPFFSLYRFLACTLSLAIPVATRTSVALVLCFLLSQPQLTPTSRADSDIDPQYAEELAALATRVLQRG